MSFRLLPNSVTLNGVMAVTLRYFTEFGKPALQKTNCGGIYACLLHFLVRVQFRRRESSRSLSHLPGFLVYVLFCNLCYPYSLVKMDCGVLFYLCFCVCSFSALTLLVGSFDQ